MAERSRPCIFVTRAREQGGTLLQALHAIGVEPKHIPAIAIREPTSFAALDAALRVMQQFDWIVFTSSNAVQRTLARAELLSLRTFPRAHRQRVAAVGSATAESLRARHLGADLVPEIMNAEGLAAALLPLIRGWATPARILLPRAEDAPDLLPTMLQAAGAAVTAVAAYRTVIPDDSVAMLRTLVNGGDTWPDGITFTSSSAVTQLLALLGRAGLSLPDSVLRFSIGPITSQTLRDHGIPPHAEAATATTASLVATIRAQLRL